MEDVGIVHPYSGEEETEAPKGGVTAQGHVSSGGEELNPQLSNAVLLTITCLASCLPQARAGSQS